MRGRGSVPYAVFGGASATVRTAVAEAATCRRERAAPGGRDATQCEPKAKQVAALFLPYYTNETGVFQNGRIHPPVSPKRFRFH